jgi:hypothetical protein
MSMKRVLVCTVLALAAAQAAYLVEWSATGFIYTYSYVYSSNSSTSYDVNGDSIPDVFVTDSTSLKVYSGVSHSLIWTIPTGGYTYVGFPNIANTDGDGAMELTVLCYSYSSSYTGKFYVYDCNTHSLEYSSPVKNGYLSMAVADVDGDNKSEACISSGTSTRILEVYGSDAAGCDDAGMAPPSLTATVMPNPATGFVRIELPGGRGRQPVEVLDAAGRVIRTLTADGPETVWDCADGAGQPVPPGVYFWRSAGASGTVTVCH